MNSFQATLQSYVRARYSLIGLQSFEEVRVRAGIEAMATKMNLPLYQWSRTKGVFHQDEPVSTIQDPFGVLTWFEDLKSKGILLLLDYHPYLKDSLTIRKLRELGQAFKLEQKSILLLSPLLQLPPEMSKEAAFLEIPLPQASEIRQLIEEAARFSPLDQSLSLEDQNQLIDASTGLTHGEIENALAKSLESKGRLDIQVVQDEKKQVVRKNGLLEFMDTQSTEIPEVGGLENLKNWIQERKEAFSDEAKEMGLPSPKGVMLVGIPGCGKSLTAQAIARIWKKPLLRLDLGRVYSSLVGSSENNIRQAIQVAETVAPSILWIDEIEKGLSGSSNGSSDGGTASRVFGTLLTWMQEKKSPVFVVATANDISKIPPEFLRKGRFDEVFFIDLPSLGERTEILSNLVRKYRWNADQLDLVALADASDGYSGAELEQVLVDAKFQAFHQKTELNQDLFFSSLKATVPLSNMMKEQVQTTRKWAVGRARFASQCLKEPDSNCLTSFQARTQSLVERSK